MVSATLARVFKTTGKAQRHRRAPRTCKEQSGSVGFCLVELALERAGLEPCEGRLDVLALVDHLWCGGDGGERRVSSSVGLRDHPHGF